MALSLDRPVPLSKLDAVNIVLRARGQAPTAQLGEGSRGSSQEAEASLAEALLAVQSEEWSFNREEDLKIDLNQDGELLLPDNILTWQVTEKYATYNVTERGGKLYDRTKATTVFTESIHIEASLAHAFEDLGQPVRWYVTLLAAFNYGNQVVPGDSSIRPTLDQLRSARGMLEAYDNGFRSRNLRNVNPHFRRLRGRR
jgi:hypothetical protein